MATYLEYLSFKRGLKWYKRLFFPWFLNKEEYDEYIRITTEEKSDLDYARDMMYYDWERYMKNDCYETRHNFERSCFIVEMLIRLESEKIN